MTTRDEIAQIVNSVAPNPVNVLISSNNCDLTVAQVADLGARRISVGGALARVAWNGFLRAAKEIKDDGSFAALADATPFGDLHGLFLKRSAPE